MTTGKSSHPKPFAHHEAQDDVEAHGIGKSSHPKPFANQEPGDEVDDGDVEGHVMKSSHPKNL